MKIKDICLDLEMNRQTAPDKFIKRLGLTLRQLWKSPNQQKAVLKYFDYHSRDITWIMMESYK